MSDIIKATVGSTIVSIQGDIKDADDIELKVEQSLVYLGQTGKSFSLGYREFEDGVHKELPVKKYIIEIPQLTH